MIGVPHFKGTVPNSLFANHIGGNHVCSMPAIHTTLRCSPVENKYSHPHSSFLYPELLVQYIHFPSWGLGIMGLTPQETPKYIICMLAKMGCKLADNPTPFWKQKEGAGLRRFGLFQKQW